MVAAEEWWACGAGPDETRRVFADRLLEAGDPRGELLAVGCSGSTAPEALARLRVLEAEYGARLVAELPGLIPGTLSWCWGLLRSCAVTRPVYRLPHPGWAGLLELRVLDIGFGLDLPDCSLPQLATLRRLVLLRPRRPPSLAEVRRARGLAQLDSVTVQLERTFDADDWHRAFEALAARPRRVDILAGLRTCSLP